MQNKIIVDVYDKDKNNIGEKTYYPNEDIKHINKWVDDIDTTITSNTSIGTLLIIGGVDFQHQNTVWIDAPNTPPPGTGKIRQFEKHNLHALSVYFSVRHCIKADWLNDRDQFLYPTSGWESDTDFHNDCLAFTLFHTQNRISSKIAVASASSQLKLSDTHNATSFPNNNGFYINHWIPFTEREIGAADDFCSHFMSDYIKDKKFSTEASSVIDAGRAVWRYYHKCFRKHEWSQADPNIKGANDASLYDIKEYFKGRNEKGNVRQKSNDYDFNELMDTLQKRLAQLAVNIKPKVFGYGFLME